MTSNRPGRKEHFVTRSRTLPFIILIALVLLIPVTAVAQDASPAAKPAGSARLFSITLPREVFPVAPVALSWDEIRIQPRFEGTLDDGHAAPARAMYVMHGDITVTVPHEALAWQGAAAVDGDATSVKAGDAITLATGDLLFVPHRPSGENNSPPALHLVNHGDLAAHIVGFRVSDAPIMPTQQVPEGMSANSLLSAVTDPDAFAAETVSVSLDRVSIAPGESIEPDPGVVAGFYQVIAGRINYGWTAPGQETPVTYSWAPLVGRWIPWADDVQVSLTALDDAPAMLLVLLVTTNGE
jgi:hypothetical protein